MSNGLELITGFAGEAHIDSSEFGLMQADMVGRDKYVTQAGTQLAITMIDNNTVEIGTGAIFNQGRYIINKAPVQLTLENGSQTLDRNVLICAEYTKNPSTLIEDASWAVVHGEPSSAPTDPEITEGNIFAGAITDMMKVYRIPFSKLTPGEPILLVDTVTSLMDLKAALDSIYHIQIGTGSVSVTAEKTGVMDITFAEPFGATPIVIASPRTPLPALRSVSVDSKTATGFRLYAYTKTTANMYYEWAAIGIK